jgi:hypothetical protein
VLAAGLIVASNRQIHITSPKSAVNAGYRIDAAKFPHRVPALLLWGIWMLGAAVRADLRVVSAIQSAYFASRVYTPYNLGRPHPSPQLKMLIFGVVLREC